MEAKLLEDWYNYLGILKGKWELGEIEGDKIVDRIRDDAGDDAVDLADHGYLISNGDIVVFSIRPVNRRLFVEEQKGGCADKSKYIVVDAWRKNKGGGINRLDTYIISRPSLIKMTTEQILKDAYNGIRVKIDKPIELKGAALCQ